MFTPKNIQGALEELYDLCDPDYMVDMLVNYSEEFDDISPALLAKSFQKNAEMISEYRVLSSAGEGIDYQGKVLLNSRAVRLLSYVEDMSGDEKVRTIQSKELWLAEDMTFYVVSCMSTITMDKEEAICLNEHRSVVTTVECEDDIFFDMGCNGVQREHNKKLNNGLPILHKVPPKRDYGRYFCIMAEKGGTSHGGLTEKLSPFFHAQKQEVNAYGK